MFALSVVLETGRPMHHPTCGFTGITGITYGIHVGKPATASLQRHFRHDLRPLFPGGADC